MGKRDLFTFFFSLTRPLSFFFSRFWRQLGWAKQRHIERFSVFFILGGSRTRGVIVWFWISIALSLSFTRCKFKNMPDGIPFNIIDLPSCVNVQSSMCEYAIVVYCWLSIPSPLFFVDSISLDPGSDMHTP
jgi:hypothetical protein